MKVKLIHSRHLPISNANDDELAVLGQALHILFQIFRADDVQNDIAASLQLFYEVVLLIVDENIGA